MEEKMIAAHKAGIAAYQAAPSAVMEQVIRHTRKLYATEQEREAYVAGYVGARRRA